MTNPPVYLLFTGETLPDTGFHGIMKPMEATSRYNTDRTAVVYRKRAEAFRQYLLTANDGMSVRMCIQGGGTMFSGDGLIKYSIAVTVNRFSIEEAD